MPRAIITAVMPHPAIASGAVLRIRFWKLESVRNRSLSSVKTRHISTSTLSVASVWRCLRLKDRDLDSFHAVWPVVAIAPPS